MELEEMANLEQEQETETPATSPVEEKTDETEEGSQPDNKVEENVPYHKDPRWMEMYNTSKESKKRAQELEEELASIREWKEQQESSKQLEPQAIPNWFKRLYGEDPEVWKEYSESTRNEKEAWKQELRDEMRKEEAEKAESLKKGEEWINDQIADLRDKGVEFDENELIKVVFENNLFDNNGNPNFQAGIKWLEMTKPQEENPNKKIASMTKGKGSDPSSKNYSYLRRPKEF